MKAIDTCSSMSAYQFGPNVALSGRRPKMAPVLKEHRPGGPLERIVRLQHGFAHS
jgi:hypothetical protein